MTKVLCVGRRVNGRLIFEKVLSGAVRRKEK